MSTHLDPPRPHMIRLLLRLRPLKRCPHCTANRTISACGIANAQAYMSELTEGPSRLTGLLHFGAELRVCDPMRVVATQSSVCVSVEVGGSRLSRSRSIDPRSNRLSAVYAVPARNPPPGLSQDWHHEDLRRCGGRLFPRIFRASEGEAKKLFHVPLPPSTQSSILWTTSEVECQPKKPPST